MDLAWNGYDRGLVKYIVKLRRKGAARAAWVVCGVAPLAGGEMRSVPRLAVAVYFHSC
jgi:hypothetical protein